MWRELIQKLENECEFNLPASHNDITAVENSLGVSLPSELKGLLEESNGVYGEYGLGLIWSTERIVHDNLVFRQTPVFKEMYMPFDHLLFFADAGNGDQFAFAILNGVMHRPHIFVWNHIDDGRTWVAPSLRTYLEWWSNGKIKI